MFETFNLSDPSVCVGQISATFQSRCKCNCNCVLVEKNKILVFLFFMLLKLPSDIDTSGTVHAVFCGKFKLNSNHCNLALQ